MSTGTCINEFSFHSKTVKVVTPESPDRFPSSETVYWAQTWPAAIGLCRFMAEHLFLIQKRTIVEMAAGLGLPGLYAAFFAQAVQVSDAEPAAVKLIHQSVQENQLGNITCEVLNWKDHSSLPIPDILLLSDINYDPMQFEELAELFHYFLNRGTTILLSSPQRLMAKPFIGQWLPYCVQQEEITVTDQGKKTLISVFVLEKQGAARLTNKK